jgi:hypothetical protein
MDVRTYLQRHTTHKTRVPPQLHRALTQSLQIPHLANHNAPPAQQPLMQQSPTLHLVFPTLPFPDAPRRIVRADQRTHFETRRIACDGDEPGFPDPLQDVNVRLHAEESGGCGCHCLARGGGEQGVVAGEAGAQEEDVAGAGLDAGFAEHGFEVGSADVAGGEGVDGFFAVLGEVAGVV